MSCVTDVAALSGIATDVEVSIREIQSLLDEEDKQEKEFQVKYIIISLTSHPAYTCISFHILLTPVKCCYGQ